MKDQSIENTNSQQPEAPFVNEECGDTMWEEVLNQMNAAEAASLIHFTI